MIAQAMRAILLASAMAATLVGRRANNAATRHCPCRTAAEQGHAFAQYSLGGMYLNGHGVPRDYTATHMCFNLAAASGFPDAEKTRGSVAARMTPAQVAEAQKLAREWKPKSTPAPP